MGISRRFGVLVVMTGCASAVDDPALLAAPAGPTPALAAEGDGVTLRWGGARALTVPAVSEGLGPVLAARRSPAGDLRLARAGGVEERWTATAAGVEQSWRFPARPAGGRVAVDVALAGATLDHADAQGLWLRTGGGVVRYGHATWVDARGRRTAVPSRWTGTRVALLVPPEVVATTAWPAVLDPLVSREFVVDPLGETTPRPFFDRPVAAFNRGVYMATWTSPVDTGSNAILYARVGPTGEVLDRYGVTLRTATAPVGVRPSIAALGDGFLLVWQAGIGTEGTFGVRLDASGAVLDAAPRALLPFGPIERPAVACRADGCLVASGPRVARLDAATGAVTPLAQLPVNAVAPALVATASGYVIAWQGSPLGGPTEIFFRRLRADGTSVDATDQSAPPAGAGRVEASLASDGAGALLLWRSTLGAGSRAPGIYGVIVPSAGAPSAPIAFTTAADAATPTAVWDGANYLASWSGFPIGTVRVSAAGAVLDATPRPLETASSHGAGAPALAVGAPGAQAFWVWSGDGTPFTAHLGADGRATAPAAVLSLLPRRQYAPRTAWDGANFVVVWNDVLPTDDLYRAARVAPDGTLVDRPAVALTAVASAPFQPFATTLISTGAGYALILGGAALRFTAAGPAPGGFTPYGMVTSRWESSVAAAPGPGANLLTYCNDGGCFARRVAPDGTSLDAFPTPLAWRVQNAGYDQVPRAAFDGTNYFVVANGYGARISAAGDLVDAAPIRLAPMPINPSSTSSLRWDISYGGGAYLLTWSGETLGARPRGVVLRPTGEVVPGPELSFGASGSQYWQVTDGSAHVLVFGTAAGLAMQRVSFAGALLDPAPVTIAPPGVVRASVSANATGKVLVASEQYDYASSVTRIVARIVDTAASPGGDGGVATDAGADVPTTVDAPAATDVGVDVATGADVGVDVAIALDAGRDAATTADVSDAGLDAAVDARVADAGSDAGAATDAGGGASADAPAVDAPAAADVAAADAGGGGEDGGGALCAARPWTRGGSARGAWLAVAAVVATGRRRRARRSSAA